MSSLHANALPNNQMAFYDEVTGTVDRGSLHDIIYLDFCGPLMVPHSFLLSTLRDMDLKVDIYMVDKELAGVTQ